MKSAMNTLAILMVLPLAMGCAPAVLGGAAAGGYKVATSERSVGTQYDDAAITTKINTAYVQDEILRARKIDVDTVDGVVTLSGVLDTQDKVDRAVQLAQKTEGVQKVNNNLTVGEMTAGESIDDTVLGSKIKAKLIAEPDVRSLNIDVDVSRGVVTLTGKTGTQELKDRIIQLARETEGAVKIIDNITIAK